MLNSNNSKLARESDRSFRCSFLKFAKAVCAAILLFMSGCKTADPGVSFIAQMDGSPPEKRPKDWERTKELMTRPAPAVGQPAPDFTLPALNDEQIITRSVHQADHPLVLI